ncbi:hypothetical protein F5884DRAFT_853059 [Xylogone sp. PMI_703]|nr:hypothetical protein F5884DRAFT_853059 [Xylogone sp. PMI_703]
MEHAQNQDQQKPWYSQYADSTWHWIEDTYLKLTGQNRTSYGTKDTLHKTEVTGIKDVDNVQRGLGDTVADTLGPGHIGGVAGDTIDKNILRGNV